MPRVLFHTKIFFKDKLFHTTFVKTPDVVNEGGAGDSATDDTVEQLENLSIANDPAADSKVNIMKYNAIIHCTLYTLHCTLHTVPCTLYTTLY